MKVLLVTGSFPPMPCGVGDYTEALARALAGRPGVEVAVLTSTAAAATAGSGVRVFAAMRTWRPSERRPAMDVVRSFRPDVVHLQFPGRGYDGSLAFRLPALLRLAKVKVVQTWHEYMPREGARRDVWYSRWRDLPGVLFGSDVVVVREAYRARMPAWLRALAAAKRFHYIPNGPSVPRVVLDEQARRAERERWGRGKALLAFFGMAYEHKGLDDLLAAMDPDRHHLVVVGDVNPADRYQADVLHRIQKPPLAGHVTVAGYLPPLAAARVLAAADAVVLPFRGGGGEWNTSIKAAALQGTFVLTTSMRRRGFDAANNVFWATPGSPSELAAALREHLGRRLDAPSALAGPSWEEIASRHVEVYDLAMTGGGRRPRHADEAQASP